jgi:hypothetical protein
MVDEVVLKNATETAWTVYWARHPDVGPQEPALPSRTAPAKERGRARE